MSKPGMALLKSGSAVTTPLPRVLRPARAAPSDAVRPTRAEINLASVRHNLRVVKRAAGSAKVYCVLKADAYGHGAKALARTLERAGADGICVALLEEALELRQAGIQLPLLVMGGYYGRASGELLRQKLTPVIHDPGQLEVLAEEVRYAAEQSFGVHLKIDTGMGRLGILPEQVQQIAALLRQYPEIRLDGLMTHFACADSADVDSLHHQLDVFDASTRELASLGYAPGIRHAANSAALLKVPRAKLDLVRPGLALFGVEPIPGSAPELKPAMRVQTQLIATRVLRSGQSVGYGSTWTAQGPSTIATIPIGYADGLPRSLSNRGAVLVRGQRAPIVGMVSMDMTMIDVSHIEGARVGDECVILGSQPGPHGQASISAQDLAAELGTIPWEVLTNISRRVPRFYREP
jgi:alanine racemase